MNTTEDTKNSYTMRLKYGLFVCMVCGLGLLITAGCSEQKKKTAPGIWDKDSVAVMVTYGVNTLVSDSGVIKYRIIAEEWEVNTNKKPSRWLFNKGILLTQFDLKKHVVAYIQCDTAVYYDQLRKWKLRGRVRIKTAKDIEFRSNELYWDELNHEIWSHQYSHLKAPDKELEGNWFRSDEQMTNYEIRKTKGWTLMKDKDKASFVPAATDQDAQLPLDSAYQDNMKGPIINR